MVVATASRVPPSSRVARACRDALCWQGETGKQKWQGIRLPWYYPSDRKVGNLLPACDCLIIKLVKGSVRTLAEG